MKIGLMYTLLIVWRVITHEAELIARLIREADEQLPTAGGAARMKYVLDGLRENHDEVSDYEWIWRGAIEMMIPVARGADVRELESLERKMS